MRTIRPAQQACAGVALGIAILLVAGANLRARPNPVPPRQAKSGSAAEQPSAFPCGDLAGFQILLDRHGFSPGEIDGMSGENFAHALAALQASQHIAQTGEPDCDTWHALGGDAAGSLLTAYTLTAEDVNGPFTEDIPSNLEAQADLPALGYESAIEAIGERFHAAPMLIEQLNPGVLLAAGTTIQVPAVQPFDAASKPEPARAIDDITIEVSRRESSLRATRGDGTLVFFAPVSSGSEHDPLPPGQWAVTSVNWYPEFHYNPDLFWDAHPSQNRATLQPGPNNPVGVVWIGVNIEHYGMHGTPEPARVGHAQSHGCVRLTNWDAARVASLVRPGTPVIFR